jgi:hypothetical protein
MLCSYAFTLLVMLSIGILGYKKVITDETAGNPLRSGCWGYLPRLSLMDAI